VDHTVEDEVKALFRKVKKEQGRLDVLVNDIWGGDVLAEWGKSFWTMSLDKGFLMMDRAIRAHIITSRWGIPLMIPRKQGLVVEITDGKSRYYRGSFFYDLCKDTAIRLAWMMSQELTKKGITALALTPGFLRSELMLDHFGVTEANWREAAKKDPLFAHSETPLYIGRAVAALAADPDVSSKAGQALATWDLYKEYGFTDADGTQPDIWPHLEAHFKKMNLEEMAS
jgi:NAD(P)-dependent dehydrogenase (short-subunit alcohol dehydrogenase family)